MWYRRLAIFMILCSFALLPSASFAYTSQICVGGGERCVASEVGPFMEGITKACGNSGTCTLDDIMMVVANVGNYITGIIGAIVLLMYTIGGLYYLSSAGNQARISKGKEYIKISSIGLFIVFFAYVGVFSLKNMIRTGSVLTLDDTTNCTGRADNASCGFNSVCKGETCISMCEYNYGIARECTVSTENNPGCVAGLCPGNQTCCPILSEVDTAPVLLPDISPAPDDFLIPESRE